MINKLALDFYTGSPISSSVVFDTRVVNIMDYFMCVNLD